MYRISYFTDTRKNEQVKYILRFLKGYRIEYICCRGNLSDNSYYFNGLFSFAFYKYSIIFACVSSIALDKIHSQNINVEVIIITRKYSREMQMEIMSTLGREITKWNSTGAYTLEGSEILYIILSKYEISQLKRMVHKYDPEAFIVVKEGVWVEGNYLRKL